MPDLNFQVEGAAPEPHTASPLMMFKLRITSADPADAIQNIALRCQIQIEATRRRYDPQEQERLRELFGEADRWSQTLSKLLWTHTSAGVPLFVGETVIDLPVPCTFDFNVAATKYFHGLADGEIPLLLQFSGTIFYRAAGGQMQVSQISWDKEARYRLPVRVWRDMIEVYYPQSAWLRLRSDVFDRLARYKAQHGLATWEEAIAGLLAAADAQQKQHEEQVPR
jgi:hypothetical protein